MSLSIAIPPVQSAPSSALNAPVVAPPPPVEFHYTQTESFVALLERLVASLVVSTYQANKLLVVRATQGGLSTLVRTFERPMGLAVDRRRLALGTRNAIWHLRNAPDIAPRIDPAAPGLHDACYVPRTCHITGDIGVHEIAWAEERKSEVRDPRSEVRGQKAEIRDQRSDVLTSDFCPLTSSSPTSDLCPLTSSSSPELWIVSTRFSCLCTLHADYSFVPRWRPPFVTALAADDRCHLNGLALVDGRPKFVTALGETDTAGGWRPDKASGGCLMDIPSGEIVSRGLSMPHSPRWHDGRLWVLESGTGRLQLVDTGTGKCQTVAELPGFTRGLAFCASYAFVGLSKIRETSAMDGVPLAKRRRELKCGVAVVDLQSGGLVALLEFQTAVEEIFDVQLLPGLRFPEIIGFQKEAIHHTFIIPPDANQQ